VGSTKGLPVTPASSIQMKTRYVVRASARDSGDPRPIRPAYRVGNRILGQQ
jgi:hypothetical protein